MTRLRRTAFALASIVLAYLLCEVLAFAGYAVVRRELFSPPRFRDARAAIIKAPRLQRPGKPGIIPDHKRDAPRAEVIHPYLGFVWDPTVMTGMNEFGFPRTSPPLGGPDTSSVAIGVFGGSFAHGIAAYSGGIVEREVSRLPAFKGKTVRVYDFSIDGYKQPQQFLTLAYFLALGAHFDIVINVDGFNEVTIPPTELISKGVFPIYPRGWFTRVQGQGFDQESIAQLGEIALAQRWRQQWAGWFQRAPLWLSPTVNMVWLVGDASIEARRQQLNVSFALHEAGQKEEISYITTGPRIDLIRGQDPYRVLAIHWGRCSLQMHRFCRANGMLYLHFLQPNQYLPGSKPLSESEQDFAYRRDSPLIEPVERGYPQLQQEGRALRARGVWFTDLSMVFANHEETLYHDDCCHCNPQGYRIVAGRIIDEIRALTSP